MLGTQLLLGLQYRAAFTEAFDKLPPAFAALDGVALLMILAATGALLAIPPLHHIADHGEATGYIIARASTHLQAALLPLACALGIDIAVGVVGTLGATMALAGGSIFVIAAVLAWYGAPFVVAEHGSEETMEDQRQSLEAGIVQALTELRVILPGAQALFGFQFTAVLTDSFDRLPSLSKDVHLASMIAVAIAIILLIAPAAYHHLAAKGRAEERVLRYTTTMMLWAIGLLSLGFVGDTYVTIRKISEWHGLAFTLAGVVLLAFIVMLYAIPLFERQRRATSKASGRNHETLLTRDCGP